MVGPALGGMVYAGIALVSGAARGGAASLPPTPRAVGLALLPLVCVTYGVVLDLSARRPAP